VVFIVVAYLWIVTKTYSRRRKCFTVCSRAPPPSLRTYPKNTGWLLSDIQLNMSTTSTILKTSWKSFRGNSHCFWHARLTKQERTVRSKPKPTPPAAYRPSHPPGTRLPPASMLFLVGGPVQLGQSSIKKVLDCLFFPQKSAEKSVATTQEIKTNIENKCIFILIVIIIVKPDTTIYVLCSFK
jgi:hypothetical protein